MCHTNKPTNLLDFRLMLQEELFIRMPLEILLCWISAVLLSVKLLERKQRMYQRLPNLLDLLLRQLELDTQKLTFSDLFWNYNLKEHWRILKMYELPLVTLRQQHSSLHFRRLFDLNLKKFKLEKDLILQNLCFWLLVDF